MKETDAEPLVMAATQWIFELASLASALGEMIAQGKRFIFEMATIPTALPLNVYFTVNQVLLPVKVRSPSCI